MNEIINNKILDLLFTSIVAEGGDGGAMWFSKYTHHKMLIPIIEKYNVINKTGWEINESDDYVLWGINQEWATITNSVDIFNMHIDDLTIVIDY